MKPVERRLMRELPVLRRHMTYSTALSLLGAGTVVAQAVLLATVLADGFAGRPFRSAPLVALGAVMALRALLAWARGALAQLAAAEAKRTLRDRIAERLRQTGPQGLADRRHGETITLLTRGLDALDPYVVGYLPTKAAVAVVPLAVVGWLLWTDWSSALIIIVTLPLIPVFGALVGMHTARRTARQWRLLATLGGHFLDVVAGLPTLRAFGRERHQARVVGEMADAHRRATMRTLRVAFLSSLVLETVATLSVAMVAVPVGLRLLGGGTDLRTALVVLFLAPRRTSRCGRRARPSTTARRASRWPSGCSRFSTRTGCVRRAPPRGSRRPVPARRTCASTGSRSTTRTAPSPLSGTCPSPWPLASTWPSWAPAASASPRSWPCSWVSCARTRAG